jgi:hypothetical protein
MKIIFIREKCANLRRQLMRRFNDQRACTQGVAVNGKFSLTHKVLFNIQGKEADFE